MTEIYSYETGRGVAIPSSWDEMPPLMTRMVFRLYHKYLVGKISPLELHVRVLYRLLGLRPGWMSLRSRGQSWDNVYLLCESCLKFLWNDSDAARLELGFRNIENPMPVVLSPRGVLHSPRTLLEDLTFAEFRHASASLQEWFITGNESDLDECLAVLYRSGRGEKNKAGRRISEKTAARDIRAVAHWPYWRKNLAMMWFVSCLDYLQKGEITIDGEKIELSALFSGTSDAGIPFTWADMLLSIAKDGAVGTVDDVDAEPLFSIIQIMWSNHKECKRYEKADKARKSE